MSLNPLDLLFLIAAFNLLAMLLVGNWRGVGSKISGRPSRRISRRRRPNVTPSKVW